MIKWKAVILGFILTVIFALILNHFMGEYGSYISILAASAIVGYMVNQNYVNGAIHGVMIGVLGGIVGIIILLLVGGYLIIKAEILIILMKIAIDIVLGAIGGVFGSIYSNWKKS
ncbi:MAG: DUF5518 domain-containing protein [Methanobacterium sp.]|uniref:DUF5518 domain-containing protein n=1 Tax=Methanobacterium sp. TaxID=2164 RepID=UPI003D64B159|nr:DUF5518 domain-containing protein [Methanobacterium sp.]